MKDFADKFDDSTFHTLYRITITSENGQRITFKDITNYTAGDIYTQLQELEDEE